MIPDWLDILLTVLFALAIGFYHLFSQFKRGQ